MPKSTTADANRRQQYELAWQGHWLYRELFDWYGGAYLKAKSPRPPWKPPAFEPAMREIVARADREWTKLTGLPPLDACNPNTWWTAAIAAGMQGQPVPNVRVLSARTLAEIIAPWATARMAAADLPVSDQPVYPLTGAGGNTFVSVSDITRQEGLTAKESKALRGRLARWRAKNKGESKWTEVKGGERGSRGSTYLYRPDAIKSVIDNGNRPSKS